MRQAFICGAFIACAAAGFSSARAAYTLNITSLIVEMTDLDSASGSTMDPVAISNALQDGEAHDYRLVYFLQVTGQGRTGLPSGNEIGFGNMDVSFGFTGSLSRSTLPAHQNYVAIVPLVIANNNLEYLYPTDTDAGTLNDLQHIVVSLPNNLVPNDGTAQDGKGNPYLEYVSHGAPPQPFGYVWVSYGGTGSGSITTIINQWSTSNSLSGGPTTLNVTSDPVNFLAPPPATISLNSWAFLSSRAVVALQRPAPHQYSAGLADGDNLADGNYQITGLDLSDGGDVPVLIDLAPGATIADINELISDVNASLGDAGTAVRVTNLAAQAPWAINLPDSDLFDILIDFRVNPGPEAFINFSGIDTVGSGSLLVDRVAAIPEPTITSFATMMGLMALARRRRFPVA